MYVQVEIMNCKKRNCKHDARPLWLKTCQKLTYNTKSQKIGRYPEWHSQPLLFHCLYAPRETCFPRSCFQHKFFCFAEKTNNIAIGDPAAIITTKGKLYKANIVSWIVGGEISSLFNLVHLFFSLAGFVGHIGTYEPGGRWQWVSWECLYITNEDTAQL